MTKYVVIYTDHGCTCNGIARILGTYNTKEEAQASMTKDVNQYLKDNADYNLDVDEVSHRIVINNVGDDACTWQILEVEV